LGQDDIFSFQYQLGDGEDLLYLGWRYLYPVTKNLDIGFYAAKSKLSLGREYKDVMSRGKSKVFSLYGTQALVKKDNFNLNLNAGFDYKDIFNFLLGSVSSQDRLRTPKIGLDLDMTDRMGRTIVTQEFSYGIPGIMGGTPEHPSADKPASRTGSGGEFVKNTLNLLRLQKLPYDATFLWKNQIQISPYILTAAEEFQIGGPANNRGYPPAEFVGDQGYSMTFELSTPVYFIPKNVKFPFIKSRIYDAFRIVAFYDWANARLRRPMAGERKNRTARSAGCGVRFNLPQNFSARFEMGWPLDDTPSDGKHIHKWIEISKSF
jgi:hemolysin activation/secretion protein